jgi:hypothetical protein
MTSNGFVTHNLTKANHMTETFKEIHTALATDQNLSRAVFIYNRRKTWSLLFIFL